MSNEQDCDLFQSFLLNLLCEYRIYGMANKDTLIKLSAELAKRDKELKQCKQELAERTLKDFRENVDGAIYETLDGLSAFGEIPRPQMEEIHRCIESTSHEFWTPDTPKPKLRHYSLQGYKYLGNRRVAWYKEVEAGK